MRLRGRFSANKVPVAPDYFVLGLYVLETQSKYAWCLKIRRGVDFARVRRRWTFP